MDLLCSDLKGIASKADVAHVTFNEDLSDPMKLIKQEIDFLGLTLNYRDKTVRIAQKTMKKLQLSWENFSKWTVRQFCSHISILLYCWFATGQRLGMYQRILQSWARVLSYIQRGLYSYDVPFSNISSDIELDLSELGAWTALALENQAIKVDNQRSPPSFILITDGSGLGWGAILVSVKSGQYTVIHGNWPQRLVEKAQKSAYAEPLALLAGIRGFFTPNVKLDVLHVTDNKGTMHQVNKGYSTSPNQTVMEVIAKEYRGLHLTSEYCPGQYIPADEPSRGMPVSGEKMIPFLQKAQDIKHSTDSGSLCFGSGLHRSVDVPNVISTATLSN